MSRSTRLNSRVGLADADGKYGLKTDVTANTSGIASNVTAIAANTAALLAVNSDKGNSLLAKLDQKTSAVIAVLGDSTGIPTHGEWPVRLGTAWAARYLTAKIQSRLWAGANYPAPTVLDDGTTTGTVASDTFTRSGELSGSTPNVGGVWTGPTGKYTMDGSKAVFTAGTSAGTAMKIPQTGPGRATVTMTWTLTTLASGGNSVWSFISEYVDTSHFFNLEIKTAAGVINFKQGATILGSSTLALAGITAASGTPQNVAVSIAHVGTTVTFTVGSLAPQAFTLSGADDLLYTAGNQAGFWGTGPNDNSVDNFLVSAVAPATNTLDIYNGSVGSTDTTYPLTQIAAMLPVAPDAVILAYSHNHLTDTPAAFETKLDTLITAIRAVYASAPIIICGQNPQYSPTANPVQHNARQADLRRYARTKGYGYIPIYEAFLSQANPQLFIESDGVHETMTGTYDGAALWSTTVQTYLNGLSFKV